MCIRLLSLSSVHSFNKKLNDVSYWGVKKWDIWRFEPNIVHGKEMAPWQMIVMTMNTMWWAHWQATTPTMEPVPNVMTIDTPQCPGPPTPTANDQ